MLKVVAVLLQIAECVINAIQVAICIVMIIAIVRIKEMPYLMFLDLMTMSITIKAILGIEYV